MKHLLNGVAIAAALAIASPVCRPRHVDAPASRPTRSTSVAPMPMKQKHRPIRHKSPKSHHHGGGKMRASAGDDASAN